MTNYFLKYIPHKYRFDLTNIKNFFGKGFSREYYSQFGEDVILGTIFEAIYKSYGSRYM